jgi:hypothetical protein
MAAIQPHLNYRQRAIMHSQKFSGGPARLFAIP